MISLAFESFFIPIGKHKKFLITLTGKILIFQFDFCVVRVITIADFFLDFLASFFISFISLSISSIIIFLKLGFYSLHHYIIINTILHKYLLLFITVLKSVKKSNCYWWCRFHWFSFN